MTENSKVNKKIRGKASEAALAHEFFISCPSDNRWIFRLRFL
jgi:hypothetical protein